jgi:hypothetical protein
MLHFASIICVLAFAGPDDIAVLDRPVPERVSGPLFAKALETKISASWRNVELRTILNRLADEHQTAVVLDRGIDPTQELDLDIDYQPLEAAFRVVAKSAGAELSILGNTIYVGPAKRVAKLRTLEHLRTRELHTKEDRLPPGRALALSRADTAHWNDLDEPRQLVIDLANNAGIAVVNPDAVPHDLWATGTLPKASIAEALTLILIQFDLTFAWSEDTAQIRLIPVPEVVTVEKPYAPKGAPSPKASREARERFLENAAKTFEEQHKGLTCRADVDNNRLLIAATLEQHEILSGSDPAHAAAHASEKFPPLSKRQFTLRIERVPATALIKKLEESGIVFKYDPAQLAAKNINLDDPISMDVNKADADEFFKAFCEPLGLKFSLSNVTVTLTPK